VSQHIAVFMYDFARTGVVGNAIRLANALAGRGHKVTLLVCRNNDRQEHPLEPGVSIAVADGPASDLRLPRPLALLASMPALHRALRRLAPDVLLSAGNHGHLAAMAASAGLARLRRILRISNELDHPGDSALLNWARRCARRLVIERADRLLLVSPHLARDPQLAQALERGRAMIVQNGVQIEAVQQQASAPCSHEWLGGDAPVVIAMGRLARQKNFSTLIRAFARAARTRPMKLIILGDGPAAERLRLESLAAELGVSDAVDLHGEVANPFPFIAGASVFVLPSLWEGASNALLEALACGTPVVAARSAGNAQQVLGYGRFGLLVDPLDVAGMAQAMLYQAGTDPCRPHSRAADFTAEAAINRACMAITAEHLPTATPAQEPALAEHA
jgi:glycosyltransferase involved in cell wall biosynthesis